MRSPSWLVALILCSVSLLSQTKTVTLYVQVTDKSGVPVRGLAQQDFTVADNKHAQNITAFKAIDGRSPDADSAAQILLVIDSVNTPIQAISTARDDVRKFLLRDGGNLSQPVSFIVVTETGTRISPDSSRDGKALVAAFDQLQTGIKNAKSFDTYQAQERLGIAMKAVSTIASYAEQKPGRKLVIWLSPGWPLMSGATVKFPPEGHAMFFKEIVRQSNALLNSGITSYTVDPLGLLDAASRRVNAYKDYLKGVKSDPEAEPAHLALQVLSLQSGGLVLHSSNDLDKEIGDCAADANSYYVVSFVPDNPGKPGEYHEVSVKVKKPDTTVRTRTGYYNPTE